MTARITYVAGTGSVVKSSELYEACLLVTYDDVGPREIRAESQTLMILKLMIVRMSVEGVSDDMTFADLERMPMQFAGARLIEDDLLTPGTYRCWVNNELYCDLIYSDMKVRL